MATLGNWYNTQIYYITNDHKSHLKCLFYWRGDSVNIIGNSVSGIDYLFKFVSGIDYLFKLKCVHLIPCSFSKGGR